MSEKLEDMKAQIERMLPADQLRLAAGLLDRKADDPLAITIADNAVMKLKAAKLFGRAK